MGDRPTLADYEQAHEDYKTVIDGDRHVLTLTDNGTSLVKIDEDCEDDQ